MLCVRLSLDFEFGELQKELLYSERSEVNNYAVLSRHVADLHNSAAAELAMLDCHVDSDFIDRMDDEAMRVGRSVSRGLL